MFGYPADMAAFERLGLPIVEDACEALGAVDADGVPVGGRGHPAVFGFYAEQADDDRRGRDGHDRRDAALKERIDSERNQGRAPDMGWLDHDRLGFNYRLSDLACALGLAQLERLDEMLAGRARVAACYREALAGIEGLELPCPEAGARPPGLVRVRGPAAARSSIATGVVPGAAPSAAIPSKPYFPAVHLMSYYREHFGHREGEFPVCEDVAARSIALPFFPQMTESPGRAGRRARCPRCSRSCRAVRPEKPDVPLRRASARRLPALNDSLSFDWRLAPYDVEQSRAHAAMLAAQRNHLAQRPRRALRRARAASSASSSEGSFPFADGDEDVHMAIERRVTELAGRGRRQAPHRALAQRPGRHRRGDVRPRARTQAAVERDPGAGPDARSSRAEAHLDWPMPGLHPPAAGPAGLPQPPPARLRVDARARPRALRAVVSPRRARCRSAPARWRA